MRTVGLTFVLLAVVGLVIFAQFDYFWDTVVPVACAIVLIVFYITMTDGEGGRSSSGAGAFGLGAMAGRFSSGGRQPTTRQGDQSEFRNFEGGGGGGDNG